MTNLYIFKEVKFSAIIGEKRVKREHESRALVIQI